MFFPLTAPLDFLVTTLAIVGFVACVARRHVNGAALGIIGLLTVAGVYATQESLPIIGLLWNPRLLPLLYFLRYLLMMVGIVEIVGLIVNAWRDRQTREPIGWLAGSVTAGTVGLSVLVVLGFMFEVLPGDGRTTFHDKNVYSWGPFLKGPDGADAQGDGWSRYNFIGLRGSHPVPRVLRRRADHGRARRDERLRPGDVGEQRGQRSVRHDDGADALPHWTDGCIGSMEGLFFEASGTTPYHFLTTAALSKQSSNPVRELRYVNNDGSVAVPHLQALGVKYAMVRTDEAQAGGGAAARAPARGDEWAVGDLRGRRRRRRRAARRPARRRQPPRRRPARAQPRARHELVPAAGGVGGDACRRRSGGRGSASTSSSTRTASCRTPTGPPTTPTHVASRSTSSCPSSRSTRSRCRRSRSATSRWASRSCRSGSTEVGVPVLVRVSYFPNWEADGAEGPYRIAPNMMVVVPTEQEVRLHYGRSSSDLFFYALTLVGIGLLIFWRIRGDARFDEPAPVPAGPPSEDDLARPAAARLTRPGRRTRSTSDVPDPAPVTTTPPDDGDGDQ